MTLGVETRRGMGALLKINSGAQQLTIRYQAFFLARPRLTRFSRSGDAGRQGSHRVKPKLYTLLFSPYDLSYPHYPCLEFPILFSPLLNSPDCICQVSNPCLMSRPGTFCGGAYRQDGRLKPLAPASPCARGSDA